MVNILDKVQPKNKAQLAQLIYYAFKHNIYDLNFIDTSKITDMFWLFRYNDYNFDVSGWDVSNVTNMSAMFYYCKNFNCDLSNWDVSNVENTSYMFYNCKNFNCDLSNWDVSKVTDMDNMFVNCKKFNCDLSDWDISNITRRKKMFYRCDKMIIPNWYKLYHKK